MLNDVESVDEPTVVVRHVTKEYPSQSSDKKFKRTKITAVLDVSLVASKGESIGLLGQNGSGKSTLLRMIAGNESPTSGEIQVSSQPSLLGVSAVMIPSLTGARNIKLALLAMGLTPDQIKEAHEEIVSVADIGDAINRPMSTYSSGMSARLKFAVSTAASPELLLMDEALGTGDAAFAQKAEARMQALLDRAGTLFFVSHAAQAVERNCARAIWMNKGQIVADGDSKSVCHQYRTWVQHRVEENFGKADALLAEVVEGYKPPRILLDSELINAES